MDRSIPVDDLAHSRLRAGRTDHVSWYMPDLDSRLGTTSIVEGNSIVEYCTLVRPACTSRWLLQPHQS